MASTKPVNKGPGRPRVADSRPSLIRALKRGESISEAHDCLENEVSDMKRRLANTFQKAIGRARVEFPGREFTSRTEASEPRRNGSVQVTITITRTK